MDVTGEVAGKLAMGTINGTVRVAEENLKAIKAKDKRDNYLKRRLELHHDYQMQYQTLSDKISVV